MNRQAATTKGLQRRIRNLQLGKVSDPRQAAKINHTLPTLLTALIGGMVTMARSLRDVEQRTEQIAKKHGEWEGIRKRLADNTLGRVLPRLDAGELVARLHAMVKAEHRRGNLEPTVLPVRTAAIDGKNVATLHWHDLCRVVALEPQNASTDEVKRRIQEQYPNVQFCEPSQGQPYALARVHTVTLISAKAGNCIHERPIEGATNEIGAMPALLRELQDTYGRTQMVEMLTTDAGNTSLEAATIIADELRWHYFSQIKSVHGELHKEAVRVLGSRRAEEADSNYADSQNGCAVTYHIWQTDLSEQGWLDWTHARQLVRVQRVTENPTTGETTIGNRYYVCSKDPKALKASVALAISRGHWRCENETHWTCDAVLQEDRRRLAWSRHPNGVFVAAMLRAIALNILAIARKLSRAEGRNETPSWHQVAEHFLGVLCASTLLMQDFDDVNE